MSTKLSPKQYQAVYLLVEGKSSTEVANKLKMRKETLSRWKRIPEFIQEYELLMEELRSGTRHHVTRLVDDSLRAVNHGVNSDYCGDQRLKTAFSVLKMLGIDQILQPDPPKTEEKPS